jgi:hypothetical protein
MLVQIVYWFNPLLWMIRRTLQNLRELCCDATVAKLLRENTCHYRQTLLDTARQLLAEPVDPGLGLLGLFENNNWLVTRLQWLEKKTWKHRRLRIATIFALVAIMAACVLPMASQPDFKVTGTVTDAVTGEPVAGVSVYDDGYNDNQHRTTTDEEGSFTLYTANEEHNITAKADGYESQTKTLKTWPLANNKDFSFQLTQNSELKTENYSATLPNGVTVELLNCWACAKIPARASNGGRLRVMHLLRRLMITRDLMRVRMRDKGLMRQRFVVQAFQRKMVSG